jgi:hypothetical protein
MWKHQGWLLGLMGSVALVNSAHAVPSYDHIVVVVEENENPTSVLNTPSATYINNVLVRDGTLLTNSHGTEHPSQPNYLDLFSGNPQGINPNDINKGFTGTDPGLPAGQNIVTIPATPASGAGAKFNADGSIGAVINPATGHVLVNQFGPIFNFGTDDPIPQALANGKPTVPLTTPNLGAALLKNGKSFAGYSESLFAGGNTDGLAVSNVGPGFDYQRKHNPWSNWVTPAPTAQNNGLPASVNLDFTVFQNIASGGNFANLPNVSFIVPNQIDDAHGDGQTGGQDLVKNADQFLSNNLEAYRKWAMTHNSLLVVTFDEDAFTPLKNAQGVFVDPKGNPVPTDALGNPLEAFFPNNIVTVLDGAGVAQGGTDNEFVNHCTVLRSIEASQGLGPLSTDGSTCDATAGVITAAFVPEPASWSLLGGILVLAGLRRRRLFIG